MLKTVFIATLVVLPLGLAIALIAYRARYFVLGIVGIALLAVLMWGGIRLAAMFDEAPESQSAGPAVTPIACVAADGTVMPLHCRL
jgi:ABC-type Na+ efflux pump permease subunit